MSQVEHRGTFPLLNTLRAVAQTKVNAVFSWYDRKAVPAGAIADVDEVVLTREVGMILGVADGKQPRIVWELKQGGNHVLWLTGNEVEEASSASA